MRDENRQGFLEPELSRAQQHAVIGVVGLSGGGSHIAQQLAHNRFQRYVVCDPKVAEEKHRERLVGITSDDIRDQRPKTAIAERVIRSIRPNAEVRTVTASWQTESAHLMGCDLIFGAVDSLRERRDLERFARQFCIPLVDIGMRVTLLPDGTPRVAGQVIVSMPGGPCMWCMGFLREDNLGQEGADYGDAGGDPQVVNVNGLLASAAVWLGIDLLTGKLGPTAPARYLSFDGNRTALQEHSRWPFVCDLACTHHDLVAQGDIILRSA